MKKFALYIMMAVALTGVVAPLSAAPFEVELQETEHVQLVVNGHTLHIIGAEGKHIDIYDTAGNLIYSADVDSHDKTVNISGRGIFIVKIDQLARKIQMR